LVSPIIDLSSSTNARLQFNHICDTEADFDFGIVELSTDGVNWQEVYRCDDQESWQEQQLDISLLDNTATAQIRFRLMTDDIMNDQGWYIDDIQVTAINNSCEIAASEDIFVNGFEG